MGGSSIHPFLPAVIFSTFPPSKKTYTTALGNAGPSHTRSCGCCFEGGKAGPEEESKNSVLREKGGRRFKSDLLLFWLCRVWIPDTSLQGRIMNGLREVAAEGCAIITHSLGEVHCPPVVFRFILILSALLFSIFSPVLRPYRHTQFLA